MVVNLHLPTPFMVAFNNRRVHRLKNNWILQQNPSDFETNLKGSHRGKGGPLRRFDLRSGTLR
uniref:Uncharacterized protein n=1 Tax=Rhizophora mucronata TaxID=61149 RepID=A0A2P2NJ66_RHIMU